MIKGFEDKQYYRVYDKDMKLIDTLEVPLEGDAEIGKEDGQYVFKDKTNGLELMFFDKSTIGTYNGASIKNSYYKIAEMQYSQEDLAQIQEMEEQDRLEEH